MPHLSFAGDSIILSSAQELGPAQPGSVLQRMETGMECVAIMPLSFDVCVFLVSKVAVVLQVEFKTYHWVRKTLEVNCYCGSLTLLGESCAWCSALLLACIQVILKITKITENDVRCENASSHFCKLCCFKVCASSVPDGDRFPKRSSCVPWCNCSSNLGFWKWELSKLDSLRICRAKRVLGGCWGAQSRPAFQIISM